MSTDFDLVCEYHKESVYVGSVSTFARTASNPHLLAAFIWCHRGCQLTTRGDTSEGYLYWTFDGDEEEEVVVRRYYNGELACMICAKAPVTPPRMTCQKCWEQHEWARVDDEHGPEPSTRTGSSIPRSIG